LRFIDKVRNETDGFDEFVWPIAVDTCDRVNEWRLRTTEKPSDGLIEQYSA